jgi:hypothetical protein
VSKFISAEGILAQYVFPQITDGRKFAALTQICRADPDGALSVPIASDCIDWHSG